VSQIVFHVKVKDGPVLDMSVEGRADRRFWAVSMQMTWLESQQ